MAENLDRELLNDVFRAYFDARRNKRNTINQLEFEFNFEQNLIRLAAEIQERTYKVDTCVCFIVNNPVKREIFAASFRDRVVHHLIFNYINPLFERKLIRDCYSCRKGLGTSDGIERIQHHLRSVTRNFTQDAYVLKLDIQGYFMSIDRRLLYDKVEHIVKSSRNRGAGRVDLELYLLKEVIFADPTENCRMKGGKGGWKGLPPSKSLFHSPEGCGLPIGNLTSQMFSNIYLADFDHYVKRTLKMKHYGRYVDDFYFMHTDKQRLLEVRDLVTEYLRDNYGLTVHPLKIYLQNVRNGVTFLGAHIKPYRNYVRKKTLGQMRKSIWRANDRLAKLNYNETLDTQTMEHMRSLLNSYFGYLGQFKTHKLRKEIWRECDGFRRYFRCDSKILKISPKEKRIASSAKDVHLFADLFPETE